MCLSVADTHTHHLAMRTKRMHAHTKTRAEHGEHDKDRSGERKQDANWARSVKPADPNKPAKYRDRSEAGQPKEEWRNGRAQEGAKKSERIWSKTEEKTRQKKGGERGQSCLPVSPSLSLFKRPPLPVITASVMMMTKATVLYADLRSPPLLLLSYLETDWSHFPHRARSVSLPPHSQRRYFPP